MNKRITLLLVAASIAVSMLFSMTACAGPAVQFTQANIDFTSFSEILNDSVFSLGDFLKQDKISIEASPVIKDADGNETTATLLYKQDSKNNNIFLNTTFLLDGNEIGLSYVSDKSQQFIAINKVLEKPFKIPLSILSDSASDDSEISLEEIGKTYNTAIKKMVSSAEITQEDTTYKVNSTEQIATKSTVTIGKDAIVAFLEDMKEPLSKLLKNGLLAYTVDYFKSLSVLPDTLAKDSIDDIITAVRESDVSISWYKLIRLGKLVEETATMNFGESGKDGKLEIYFNEKDVSGYSTGTIEISATDSSENKTSLYKINYTDDDGAVKLVISVYNLITLTVKTQTTTTDGKATQSSTYSISTTIGGSEFALDFKTTSTVSESTGNSKTIDVTGDISSTTNTDLALNVTAQLKATASADISLDEYSNENCFVLTNNADGANLYTTFISAFEGKYPSRAGMFPSDLTQDGTFTGEDIIANINGTDVPASPYIFSLQNTRDYYELNYYTDTSGISTFADNLNTEEVNGKILADYITDSAKEDFVTAYIIGQKFDELGLSLSFKDLFDIANTVASKYSDEIMSAVTSQMGLSEANIRYLASTSLKQDKISDYYFGENGISKISSEALTDIYNSDYYGVRFVLLQKQSADGTAYTDEEMAQKKSDLEAIIAQLQSGETTMEDAIKTYSDMCFKEEDYANYPDYKDMMDEDNQAQVNGYTLNKTGESATEQVQFSDVFTSAVSALSIGDYSIITDTYGLWLVQRIDNPHSYDEMVEVVKADANTSELMKMFDEWKAASGYVFNDETVAKYSINNMSLLFN